MALFLSTYTNKIDKKGRVSVPAQFRSVLSGQNLDGIVAYPSVVNNCIEACGIDRIERMSASIDDNHELYSDERDAFAMSILGDSSPLSFDSDGRVTLPEKLLKEAGLDGQAVFVGKGQTFEIWEPKAFEEYSAKAREIAKQKREEFRLNGRNDN